MKFLLLAFFVSAASAATFPVYKAKATASVVSKPVSNVQVAAVPEVPVVKAESFANNYNVKAVNNKEDDAAVILKYNSDVDAEKFAYGYETSNGIVANSEGELKVVDNTPALIIRGQYGYVAPDGTPVQISYVADENGYQPQGDLLPKDHPIPEPILRALKYIEAHPAPVEYKKN